MSTNSQIDTEILEMDHRWSKILMLRLLWMERALILRITGWGFLSFIAIALLIPRKYDSTTRLMPPDNQGGSGLSMVAALVGGGGGGASGIGTLGSLAGDLLGAKNTGDMFIGVLRSQTVEDALVRRFDLRKVYSARYWETARKKLEDRTDIHADRKSGIIEITVRDGNRERSQAMARAYVEELDKAVATLSVSSARREREFLEQRLKTVKVELDQAARDFSKFSSENATIDIGAQAKAMVEGVARIQGALIEAEAEEQGLAQIYSPSNVRVRAAQAKVQELRQQLKNLGGTDEQLQGLNPHSGNPSGGTKESGAESVYPSIRELPLLAVPYSDLYRRIKIQETVYDILTKEYELAKVEEAKEIPTVRVLDPASYPEKKSFPPTVAVILGGTIIAAFYGILWVIAKKRFDDIDPADPVKGFVLEVIEGIRGRVSLVKHRLLRRFGRFPATNSD